LRSAFRAVRDLEVEPDARRRYGFGAFRLWILNP